MGMIWGKLHHWDPKRKSPECFRVPSLWRLGFRSRNAVSNFWVVSNFVMMFCFGRKTHRKTSKDHIVSPVLIGILRVPLQCHSFQEISTMMMNTLPPIIMEVEDDPIIKETILGGTHGPNFHDYGRKEETPFSWPLFPWGVGIGGVSLDSRVQFITWLSQFKQLFCSPFCFDETCQTTAGIFDASNFDSMVSRRGRSFGILVLLLSFQLYWDCNLKHSNGWKPLNLGENVKWIFGLHFFEFYLPSRENVALFVLYESCDSMTLFYPLSGSNLFLFQIDFRNFLHIFL